MVTRSSLSAALISLAILSGCATVFSDKSTKTYIRTVPDLARCELKGEGFQRVVTTPTRLPLPAKAAPISVNCTLDSFKPGVAVLHTSPDGWVFGNAIIIGGVIGAMIDARSGAGMHYPEDIEIVPEPAMFATREARDEFYDQWRVRTEVRWAELIGKLETRCRTDSAMEPAVCEMRLEKLKSRRAAELFIIEGKRNGAVVEPAEPAIAL